MSTEDREGARPGSDADGAIAALLAAERARPEPDAAIKAAVAGRVAAVVGAGAAGGASAGADGPGPGTPLAGGARKVILAAIVGAVVGGTAVAVLLPPRVVVESREATAPPPPAPAPCANAPGSSGPLETTSDDAGANLGASTRIDAGPAAAGGKPATTGATATSGAVDAAGTTGAHDADLARERALVDRARSALARGDAAGALQATEEHRRAFPRGQLSEEREALAIQALAGAGRADEAANRAGAFRKAYPTSLLLPIVDAALRPR